MINKRGKMGVINKIVGSILIILGALPLLLKIGSVAEWFSSYTFLNWIVPGEILYQLVLIVLGILLVVRIKPKVTTSS